MHWTHFLKAPMQLEKQWSGIWCYTCSWGCLHDPHASTEQSWYAYVQRLTVTEAHAHATLSRARMPTGHLCPLNANRSLPTYWPLEEAASSTSFSPRTEKVKRKGRCQKSSPPSRTPQLNRKRSLGVPSWQWWQWQLQNINIAVYKYLYVHICCASATFTRICMYLALPTINNMLRPLWWFKSDTKEALNSMQTASGNPGLFAISVTALDAHTDCIPEQSSYAYVQHDWRSQK